MMDEVPIGRSKARIAEERATFDQIEKHGKVIALQLTTVYSWLGFGFWQRIHKPDTMTFDREFDEIGKYRNAGND